MRRLLPLLLLAPTAALAQTTSGLVLQVNGADSVLVGGSAEACSSAVTVSYSLNGVACDSLKIWLAASSCSDAPASGDLEIFERSSNDVNSNRTGTASFTVSQLPMFTADKPCPLTGTTATNKVCAAVKTLGGTFGSDCQTTPQKDSLQVDYDSKPPPTPVLHGVIARDSALGVEVTLADDVSGYRIEASVAGEDNWATSELFSPGTNAFIGGLENNVVYDVRVIAEDEVGNATPPSGVLQGTPIESCGFRCHFGDASFNGGCTAAGGLPMLPALLALLCVRRRKK